jgi:Holliday junction resolvase RusA-like endonuclease
VPPDLDKLTRAVLDGLTRAGVWADDGQVVELRATKCYDDDHPPGVDLWVWPLDGQDQPELPD